VNVVEMASQAAFVMIVTWGVVVIRVRLEKGLRGYRDRE
jgi:hypothetical protein